MQLKKLNHKLAYPAPLVRAKFVKIESFNPVMKSGYEIAHFTTVHNFGQVAHGLVVMQPRARS